jgi:hypothetical protein
MNNDFYWSDVKKWWNNIETNDEIFNFYNFNKKTENEKNIFKIKFLYMLKQIFEIENIDHIDKIICTNEICTNEINNKSNIHLISSTKIYNNIIKNKNILNLFLEDNHKLKELSEYIIQYNNLFKLLISKILNIIKPIFKEKFFKKIINSDEDITRIISPILGTFMHLYITNNDITYVIDTFLKLDHVYMEFFMISYLIIDDVIDNNKIDDNEKKKFMKWLMNIVLNPSNNIIINLDVDNKYKKDNLWRYTLFKKYFKKFLKKYPVSKFQIIYDYIKIMMDTLNIANKIQHDKNSSEDLILEYSFKKSYVVSYFISILVNIELNKSLNENHIIKLSKLVFLIQLYDDVADIKKDVIENNNTYFTIENDMFDFRLKKLICATYNFLNSFENIDETIHNKNINNIIYIFLENNLLYILYKNHDKINSHSEFLNKFLDNSFLSFDCLKYFDDFNSNILIEIFNKNI